MAVLDMAEPSGDGHEQSSGMLAPVGVSADEERVYLSVLDRPGNAAPTIARNVGLAREACERALAALAANGLLTVEPGPRPRFRAVAPDVAIEALIARHQEELARARLAAVNLRQRARLVAGPGDADGAASVESISGGPAARQRLSQLQLTADREVLAAGLPVEAAGADQEHEPVELTCLRRGVAYRAVYTRDALASAGALDAVRRYAEAGVSVRVAEVPTRFLLVDGETAVLPFDTGGDIAGAVVVRSAPVVKALAVLGELTWRQAAPLEFSADEVGMAESENAKADLGKLVPLLVAGCKDETIARQLGVSTRTLDRRLRVLMDGLGAVTRFQAGWLAACRRPGVLARGVRSSVGL